jgi:hypothetical protein
MHSAKLWEAEEDWLTRRAGLVGDPSLRLKNGSARDDASMGKLRKRHLYRRLPDF